jgi:spore coat protein A, manganese oxidase
MSRLTRSLIAIISLFLSSAALAAIPFTPPIAPAKPSLTNNAFPTQNPLGPTGTAYQVNYPYPGQCLADPANVALFPLLGACTGPGSFACTGGASPRSGGDWAACGAPTPFAVVNPILANSLPLAGLPATPKFRYQVLNPPDYTANQTTFPGADYYEIQLHEAWGFQALADLSLFPDPKVFDPILATSPFGVPNGMQWTGLVCNIAAGCACPSDASATFRSSFCTSATGKIPVGKPLFTPIWGVGSALNGLAAPGTPSPWSANNFVATWPSISIRGTRGTPVVVKWTNEFPNNHVLCPHPEAADWPCAIDRTFMGVKARIDPASATASVPPDGVNQYGSPQQPDNSWVTHLHGGEIPPSTDGFAEKWFGNSTTAAAYAGVNGNYVSPPFEPPYASSLDPLSRPAGRNFDTYTYPMVQEEALIWFHDHTLGKTHHNVIAGPAGFFPVKDPTKHGLIGPAGCAGGAASCAYTWLDPVTEPRGAVGIPMYDLFLAIQDRSFNEDGSVDFSNGLGQVIPAAAKLVLPAGYSPVTNGVNPLVHPTWIPEYFGDHVLVNGVLWPYKDVAAGWYRIRVVDGSDSRCWTVGLSSVLPAPGTKPVNNVPFWVLANDQGYLRAPVPAPGNQFTMCPGERYELLVNFAGFTNVYMTNSAPAPFPAGLTPFAQGSPFAEMNSIMRFVVNGPTAAPPVPSCLAGKVPGSGVSCMPANPGLQVDPTWTDIRPVLPFAAGTVVRQVYLNERVDGVTQAPLGMQLNGVPFEYKVTETPIKGSTEVWQFVNLTVDAHPMHPHFIKHQIVARQTFNVGGYKAALCGSSTCQPGTSPGGEMQVVPDVTPFLQGSPTRVTAANVDGGWKDASQALPGLVTTIIGNWTPRWNAAATVAGATAPGTAGCPAGTVGCAAPYVYEDVTSGPYVWHCHINSHEDSEMMRTSLVVPPTPLR